VIIYNTDQTDNRTALEANIGEVYGIAGIPAYEDTVNGFVETWYDQSGNGNDATQSVAGSQPKIVDGGVLVTGGLDFDGVNDALNFSSVRPISSINSVSHFFIGSCASPSSTMGGVTLSEYPSRWYFPLISSATVKLTYGDPSKVINLGASDTGSHLFSAFAGASTVEAFNNGVSGGTLTPESGAKGGFVIGGIGTSFPWNGSMSEIIIYNTDQSANREAIEANINNQYDIY